MQFRANLKYVLSVAVGFFSEKSYRNVTVNEQTNPCLVIYLSNKNIDDTELV